MKDKDHLDEGADIEAFADGNLDDDGAKSVEAHMRRDFRALDRMFGLARLNAALRKAKNTAYQDEKLSEKLTTLTKK